MVCYITVVRIIDLFKFVAAPSTPIFTIFPQGIFVYNPYNYSSTKYDKHVIRIFIFNNTITVREYLILVAIPMLVQHAVFLKILEKVSK